MKPTLINRTMTPPEKMSDEKESLENLVAWIKRNYKIEDLFDTYEHDKEISIRFHKWMMDYNSVHLVDILSDKPQPTYEELWDLFNSPDNTLPLHEGEEFKL